MGRKLILDTGVFVAAERGRLALDSFDYQDDLSMAAVSVAELLLGVELADGRNRVGRRKFIEYVLDLVPVVEYTTDIARAHAYLLGHVKRTGTARGAHDLIIAATAAVENRVLVTTDGSARFDDLPGIESVLLPA